MAAAKQASGERSAIKQNMAAGVWRWHVAAWRK